jgi:hypothetical protein
VDVQEFETHLVRYGSSIEDWPPNLRTAAHILCTLDSTAQTLIDEDRALRAIFAEQPKLRAPTDLIDRIMLEARRSNGTPR